MNGYELSRNYFDWCFENPEKVSPNHTAIYFFAIEHCNRLGWRDKFGFPTQMAMDAIGIKKNQTYTRYLNDLVDFGFIKMVEKSKNQYSANIISLQSAKPKNGKALDKAIVKHEVKQTESIGQSNSTIDKPLTINNKPLTINKNDLIFNELIISESWIEVVAMNSKHKLNPSQVKAWLKKYNTTINTQFEFKNNKTEYCTHFTRWLDTREKTENKTKTPLL